MKYLFLCLALIAGLGAQAQPNEKAVIEEAAYNFLMAYNIFDMHGAMKYSDTETIEFLNEIQKLLDAFPIPDSVLDVRLQAEIKIHPIETKVTGDSTRIFYRIVFPISSDFLPIGENLKMVKRDGAWLVHYDMQEAMAQLKNRDQTGEAVEPYPDPSNVDDKDR